MPFGLGNMVRWWRSMPYSDSEHDMHFTLLSLALDVCKGRRLRAVVNGAARRGCTGGSRQVLWSSGARPVVFSPSSQVRGWMITRGAARGLKGGEYG